MREIETDYLVVGAGAAGMAFVDTLIDSAEDVDVVLVDRRHRPGGHWNDAYPFVRLHQPSANYGVPSRQLGHDRIDESGPNAGFYERATAAELCDYYSRVLDEQFLPSGRVRFFGMSDYQGTQSGEHAFASMLTGEPTTVRVRRKLVDARYVESPVPATHTPTYDMDDGIRVLPPGDLVGLAEPASGYTVIGAGKTSMDTCCWLIEQGVDPDAIRWIRPRDAWTIDRAAMQPLSLLPTGILQFQSRLVEAVVGASSPAEPFHRLEDVGIVHRLDDQVEPEVFRAAILSAGERDVLRRVGDVVRKGRVRSLEASRVLLEHGEMKARRGEVYVDCTAPGLLPRPMVPIFDGGRITIQMTTGGIAPLSAAVIAFAEAARDDNSEKNRLCEPVPFTGEVSGLLRYVQASLRGVGARMAEPDFTEWNDGCRLNPMLGASEQMDDPAVQEAFGRLLSSMGPAMESLERQVAQLTG